ncbi:hypothetical protein FJZ53_01370 [Candidatus Woesearchaeota archaeon]|nr:hypothetical protein [Candidatus Woesearchaeota archaeon]
MEENQETKIEEVKALYVKVLEKFPSLLFKEPRIDYDSSGGRYAAMSILDERGRKDPVVLVGRIFFSLEDSEKEAIFAHELGHYCTMRNYSVERLKRTSMWTYRSSFYEASHALANKRFSHEIKRLQKWTNMREIDADNKAAEAGYGKEVLQALKKTCEESWENCSMIGQNSLLARISNLEKKLKQEPLIE